MASDDVPWAAAVASRSRSDRAVWMRPGATLFTRIFSGPSSMESSLLNIRTAALQALPGVCSGTACCVVPVMLMMVPPPRRRRCGMPAFAQRMYPRSFPLIASTKASSGKSTNAPKAEAPALLTRMSMPPNRSAACATNL